MIHRAAVALFWLTLFGLALAGAYVAIFDLPTLPARDAGLPPSVRDAGSAGAGDRDLDWPPAQRGSENPGPALRRAGARAPEPGPRARDLRRVDRQRVRAEPVARRFFAAFSRYELGELDPRIGAQLRATATEGLVAVLIESPPRTTTLSSSTTRGQLGRLIFVAGEVSSRGELRGAELVGWVKRGARRSPIAIEVVQMKGERRVSGVGR
jgi:hypothetical protein